MSELLTKLRPDRDLQCYFRRPSAVAALSGASATGFTLSGCWREAFDWAVVEWNRDNVFEHPALRNLPDGDLSGVRLSYEETRSNCVPFDSTLQPNVEWPYLRIWATDAGGAEAVYFVPLKNHATALGEYTPATCRFELEGTPTKDDYVELAWLDQHFNFQVWGDDNLPHVASMVAAAINAGQGTGQVTATSDGAAVELTYLGLPGANGNRIGVYGTVHGAQTESWNPQWAMFSGGASPDRWRVDLDFGALEGYKYPDLVHTVQVPMHNVRKMRWTWAADLQVGDFARSEFAVTVSNWSVTGTGLGYQVAGPGSRRIEDDSEDMTYSGSWAEGRGNFSGGSVRYTIEPGASVECRYTVGAAHRLYLGTRRADVCTHVRLEVDGTAMPEANLQLDEDVLLRLPLGELAANVEHTVRVTHAGEPGEYFYLDFLEIAVPAEALPEFEMESRTSLATDWDTDHSLALPPERTAWLIDKLGFGGRENHYVGALWFYELCRPGHQYASATITFGGTPAFGATSRIWLGQTTIDHMSLIGDTCESVAKAFELLINSGSNAVWARAEGAVLTITARAMGTAGNGLAFDAQTYVGGFTVQRSGPALEGGGDRAVSTGRTAKLGTARYWVTDVNAMPRLNRAARDWSRSFYQALQGYGIEVTAAFSMELQHGDDEPAAGLAQRYPDGSAAWLTTPALQTNFGPQSTAYWRQVFADMATVMTEAGVVPYLQFGETQWWYNAGASGMPFYDAETMAGFQAAYGRPMAVIASADTPPAGVLTECGYLAGRVGEFTDAVMAFVRTAHAATLFEVLYPVDVNDTDLNRLVNYPTGSWTSDRIECLKTENFIYTGERNLDKARMSIGLPMEKGFPAQKSSHLVGIGEYATPWQKERRLAIEEGVESVVLFAVDQLCLIGYKLPLERGMSRARFWGR